MAEEQDPLIGTQIRDYKLERMIGHGAMGVVYLGRHVAEGREVAVKFLSGEFSTKEEYVKRFIHEAQMAAQLRHDNLIQVLDAGEEQGVHFIVMEHVDGVDLGHLLRVQERVKEAQARPWMKQVAAALGYAHSEGIIHRDLKPDNIMVTKKGLVKVADLGLSKELDAADTFSVTMSGTVIGTPYYISPEQIKNAKHVDNRSDIYSMGATFYHLLTGSPPFDGESAAEVMSKHINEQLADPRRKNQALSDGVADLLYHMLEKDPMKRFQSMEEVLESLNRIEMGQHAIQTRIRLKNARSSAHGASPDPVGKKRSIQPPSRPLLLSACAIAILTITAMFLGTLSEKKGEIQTPEGISRAMSAAAGAGKSSTIRKQPDSRRPAGEAAQNSAPAEQPLDADSIIQNELTAAAGTETDSQEEIIALGEDSGGRMGLPINLKVSNFNWVDALALAMLFTGIPFARQIGSVWGSVRAVLFLVGVYGTFKLFQFPSQWLVTSLSLPENVSVIFSYFLISVLLLIPGYVITNRLRGYQKDTWQFRLDQVLALIPGVAMGLGVAAWILAFLLLAGSENLPIRESFFGSRLIYHFPALSSVT
jgi:serine/threonine protein kinase